MTSPFVVAILATVFACMALLRAGARVRARGRRRGRVVGRRHSPQQPDYARMLDAIARRVRSGDSLGGAVVEEVDRSSPLGDVVTRLMDGESLVHAVSARSNGTRHADLALATQALSACAHLGGSVAVTLDDAAAVLRERAAARAERAAHSSQARLSARVLTIVPIVFAAWSAAASRETRDIYATTAAGGICAISGLALNVSGWRWMKRIIGAP